MNATPSRQFGFVMLALVALGWGINWPVMKIIVAEVPIWQFRAVTGLAAGLAMFAMARLLRQSVALPRAQWLPLLVAALINVTAWFVLVGYGVLLMGSGHASILAFTMPIWAALQGVVLFGERLSGRRMLSLAMGAAGVVVLLSHDLAAVGANPLGAILILAAAFAWAIGVHIQKRVKWRVEATALAAWQITLGSLPIAVIAALIEPFVYHEASATAIAGSVYVAAFALAFCYYAWFVAVRIFPTQVSAISSLSVPVVGVVSAALALGEPFGWREVAALVLVVGAVAMVVLQPAPVPETGGASRGAE